jgi:hypothetical protein
MEAAKGPGAPGPQGALESHSEVVVGAPTGDAAGLQLGQLVAQTGDARRGHVWFVEHASKKIARVRFKGHDARGHAALTRFVV